MAENKNTGTNQTDQNTGMSVEAVSRTQELSGKTQEKLKDIATKEVDKAQEPSSLQEQDKTAQYAINEMIRSPEARDKEVTDGKGSIQKEIEQEVTKKIENDSNSPASFLGASQEKETGMSFASAEKNGIMKDFSPDDKKEVENAKNTVEKAWDSPSTHSVASAPGRQRSEGMGGVN